MKKNLFIKKEIAVYANFEVNGEIVLTPFYDEVKVSESVTQNGVVASYRGRVKVNSDGNAHIVPYNERPRGKRPVKLFSTPHCIVKQHADGSLTEHWRFEPDLLPMEVKRLRTSEMIQVSRFYSRYESNPLFVVAEC